MKKENMTEQQMKAFLAAQNPPAALRAAGWTPRDLVMGGWTPGILRAAGWPPTHLGLTSWMRSDLREAGWTLKDLRIIGWTLKDMTMAGWTPENMVAAGWTLDDMVAAGWTSDDMVAAGWTPGKLAATQKEWDDIPLIPNLYSRLLDDIENHRRQHDQKAWPPERRPEKENICATPMCTAGHLVDMAGDIGYALKAKYSWSIAAEMIHMKNRPDAPVQDFGAIPQDFALAYIRERAAEERSGEARGSSARRGNG